MDLEKTWFGIVIPVSSIGAVVELALAIIHGLRFSSSDSIKQPLLTTAGFAFLTAVLHINTASQWRRYRKGWTQTCILYSTSLLLFTLLAASTWFILSIVLFVFASKPIRPRSSSSVLPFGSATDNPLMPWIVAMLGYVLSGLAWIEFGLVAYYRHLSRKPFAAAPQNKIIAKPHTWWILGLILGGMILAYLALGGSLGDGAYGGYNLWIVPALVILTEALHATALPLWKGTAKNRRGTINPPFIYSITLLVLLSLLASAWTAAGVISFFILTGKLDNSKYITWSTYFKTGNAALPYVRWTTAGLAVGVAILTWAQFGVTLWYRIKFFKKVKNALGNSQPAANNANATNNTANNANSNNNTNTTSSNANANTHSEVNALYSQSTTHLNPYNPFTNNQYPQSTPSIPNTPYTTPYPPGQLYPTASQQNLPYAHPDYAAPAYTPAQNTGYNPVYQPASHPMNPFFQRDTSV